MNLTDFGRLVKYERLARGMSMDDAAAAGSLSHMTWRRIERGLSVQSRTYLAVDKAFSFQEGSAIRVVEIGEPWPGSSDDLAQAVDALTVDHRVAFGERVQADRLQLGMSVDKACALGGVTPKTWQRIERGLPINQLSLSAVDEALALQRGTAFAVYRGEIDWPSSRRPSTLSFAPRPTGDVLRGLVDASVLAGRMRVLTFGGAS